ncbi:MAG: hypothetical protein DI585_05915 [Pseudomonas fluorescens]|nr:MAG: hypothetical protein DI585_05915 [Pseudomonas fluorescens]
MTRSSALTHSRATTLPTACGIRLEFDFEGRKAGEYPKLAEIKRRVKHLMADLYLAYGDESFTYRVDDIELACLVDTEGNISPYHVDVAIGIDSEAFSLVQVMEFARELTLSVERLADTHARWEAVIQTNIQIDAF